MALRLYLESVEVRLAARAHLARCLRLYVEACAQVEEWDAALDAAIRLRRRLTADEVELLAFGQAERAKWLHRLVRADRLLASAQGNFEDAHRPALPRQDHEGGRDMADVRAETRAASRVPVPKTTNAPVRAA